MTTIEPRLYSFPGLNRTTGLVVLYELNRAGQTFYLAVNVEDAYGTSSINAPELLYGALLQEREGDAHFRLFHYFPNVSEALTETVHDGELRTVNMKPASFAEQKNDQMVDSPAARFLHHGDIRTFLQLDEDEVALINRRTFGDHLNTECVY